MSRPNRQNRPLIHEHEAEAEIEAENIDHDHDRDPITLDPDQKDVQALEALVYGAQDLDRFHRAEAVLIHDLDHVRDREVMMNAATAVAGALLTIVHDLLINEVVGLIAVVSEIFALIAEEIVAILVAGETVGGN